MAIRALEPRRAIIVGAGASVPYGLPLAGELLEDAISRISELDNKYRLKRAFTEPPPSDIMVVAKGDEISEIIAKTVKRSTSFELVAKAFRENLVQQNLDDFVRDHPSLTEVISILITIKLFTALYEKNDDGTWGLRPQFTVFGSKLQKDWMRQFVGIARPLASPENKLRIISFNYDYLLERTVTMYWSGSETKYAELDDAVEFVYPHGRFSELPERVHTAEDFLVKQAAQLRLGNNVDQAARDRAKQIIAEATRKYFIGFSFADTNIELLDLNDAKMSGAFVQNYNNIDVRLNRKLAQLLVSERQRDQGGYVRAGS